MRCPCRPRCPIPRRPSSRWRKSTIPSWPPICRTSVLPRARRNWPSQPCIRPSSWKPGRSTVTAAATVTAGSTASMSWPRCAGTCSTAAPTWKASARPRRGNARPGRTYTITWTPCAWTWNPPGATIWRPRNNTSSTPRPWKTIPTPGRPTMTSSCWVRAACWTCWIRRTNFTIPPARPRPPAAISL